MSIYALQAVVIMMFGNVDYSETLYHTQIN